MAGREPVISVCKSQLLILNAIDLIACALDEGHNGFHWNTGTIPAYAEDPTAGGVIDDAEVRWAIIWND